jgi:hypothetical protein
LRARRQLSRAAVSRASASSSQRCVKGQHQRKIIRRGGRRLLERAPEARNQVARLAAEHPLRAEIDGGVWIKLKGEEFRMRARVRRHAEFERTGDACGLRRVGRFTKNGEGAEEFHHSQFHHSTPTSSRLSGRR